jgi:hypothetical protein
VDGFKGKGLIIYFVFFRLYVIGWGLSSLFPHLSVVSIFFLASNFSHLVFEVFTARIQTAHPPLPRPFVLTNRSRRAESMRWTAKIRISVLYASLSSSRSIYHRHCLNLSIIYCNQKSSKLSPSASSLIRSPSVSRLCRGRVSVLTRGVVLATSLLNWSIIGFSTRMRSSFLSRNSIDDDMRVALSSIYKLRHSVTLNHVPLL